MIKTWLANHDQTLCAALVAFHLCQTQFEKFHPWLKSTQSTNIPWECILWNKCTLALGMFLPDGETVWKTKPLADAEALTVLDVRDDNRESVFLLCFRNDPLEDWNRGNIGKQDFVILTQEKKYVVLPLHYPLYNTGGLFGECCAEIILIYLLLTQKYSLTVFFFITGVTLLFGSTIIAWGLLIGAKWKSKSTIRNYKMPRIAWE